MVEIAIILINIGKSSSVQIGAMINAIEKLRHTAKVNAKKGE